MRKSIKVEFGAQRPRAIVLDDRTQTRQMTARRLKKNGFEVVECKNVAAFRDAWRPGMFDVIVADWQLSGDLSEAGDHVLEEVRSKDWDVCFVLVSGKLDEDTERAQVLARLLDNGGARFVRRGSAGIERACKEAEDLMDRRDLALLKIILSLRPSAMTGQSVPTSSGDKLVATLLAEAVAHPSTSHAMGRPIAAARAKRSAASAVAK